jgi:hypothetical protein
MRRSRSNPTDLLEVRLAEEAKQLRAQAVTQNAASQLWAAWSILLTFRKC